MLGCQKGVFLCGVAVAAFWGGPALAQSNAPAAALGTPDGARADPAPQSPSAEAASVSGQAGQPTEIVVTARRRAESLQNVPLAVSVLSGDALREAGIEETKDLYGRIPGLYFSNADNGAPSTDLTYLNIRGIGFNGGLEPAVGVFIDGMYQPQLGFDVGFLDLARLEVLRGPQGTLFGRNTQAGALNLVTRRPGRDVAGRAEAEVASFDTYRAFGSVSGPLGGAFSGGLAAEYLTTDGYLRNITLDRPHNPDRRASVRGSLRYNAGGIDLLLTADHTKRSGNEIGYGVPYDCHCYSTRDDEYDTDTRKNSGVQFNADARLSDVWSISSITGYRKIDSDTTLDFDAKPTGQTPITVTGAPGSRIAPGPVTYQGFNQRLVVGQKFFSQELRLNYSTPRLNALLGAYYFSQKQRQYRRFAIGPDVVTVPAVAALVPLIVIEDYLTDRDGTALFGQASWRPVEKLEFTVGGRYAKENVEIDGERLRNIFKIENAHPQFFRPKGKDDFSNFSWTGSISYRFAPRNQVYATVARGWKAGGFSRFPGSVNAALPYDSETSTNYELGLKSSWLDNRLVANLAAFYIDIKGQQLSTVIPDPNGIPVSTIANAGRSRSKGFEAEIYARPTERLTLAFNASYTHGRFTKFDLCSTSACIDQAGRRFTSVPDWIVGGSAEYSIPLGTDRGIDLFGEYRYIGSIEVPETTFTSPLGSRLKVPGYDRVNARATFRQGRWSLTAYVDNLLDKYDYFNTTYQLFELRSQANQLVQPLPPRRIGLIGAYKF